LLAILDDVLRRQRIHAGDVAKQRYAGGIEIDANRVDAGLDHSVK